MCRCRVDFRVKCLLQIGQPKGRSCVWIRRWRVREEDCALKASKSGHQFPNGCADPSQPTSVNFRSHKSHSNGLSPVCFLICTTKACLWMNRLGQSGQAKGRSSRWILTCRRQSARRVNRRPHPGYWLDKDWPKNCERKARVWGTRNGEGRQRSVESFLTPCS